MCTIMWVVLCHRISYHVTREKKFNAVDDVTKAIFIPVHSILVPFVCLSHFGNICWDRKPQAAAVLFICLLAIPWIGFSCKHHNTYIYNKQTHKKTTRDRHRERERKMEGDEKLDVEREKMVLISPE